MTPQQDRDCAILMAQILALHRGRLIVFIQTQYELSPRNCAIMADDLIDQANGIAADRRKDFDSPVDCDLVHDFLDDLHHRLYFVGFWLSEHFAHTDADLPVRARPSLSDLPAPPADDDDA